MASADAFLLLARSRVNLSEITQEFIRLEGPVETEALRQKIEYNLAMLRNILFVTSDGYEYSEALSERSSLETAFEQLLSRLQTTTLEFVAITCKEESVSEEDTGENSVNVHEKRELSGNEMNPTSKNNGALSECPICMEEDCQDFVELSCCSHAYCIDCIRAYIDNKMDEFDVRRLKCPDVKCSQELLLSQLQEVLEPAKYSRLMELIAKKKESLDRDIVWCPNPKGCDSHISLSEVSASLSKDKSVECSKCKYEYCVECKSAAHKNETCMQHRLKKKKQTRKWNFVRAKKVEYTEEESDAKTQMWKEKNVKNCPHCGAESIRISGCTHMSCPRCNSHWHWNEKKRKTLLDFGADYPTVMIELAGSREFHGRLRRKPGQNIVVHGFNVLQCIAEGIVAGITVTVICLPIYVVVAPYRFVKRVFTKKN